MIRITVSEGLQPYNEMLDKQRSIFNNMVAQKREQGRVEEEHIFIVEHSPVITLGKHAKRDNVLISERMLSLKGIKLFEIERGGDVTYHGPGQLVVYPLIDLEAHHLGVKSYIHILEESVIRTIAHYGIKGERVEGATGVWIDAGTSHERKICAIGVKCSRFITMHGLALNVNTDLQQFSLINPCGFIDKGVTSIASEVGHPVNFKETARLLTDNLLKLLNLPK